MTIALDKIVEAGGVRAAALAKRSVTVRGGRRRRIRGAGFKEPVALLVAVGDDVRAFAPNGVEMAPDDVERLCPGALAAFTAGG